jgi:acid phosphatase (class A)
MRLSTLAAFFLLTALDASGAPAASDAAPAFVSLTAEQIRADVPMWPDNDSLAGRSDLEVVLAQQVLRSAELADHAERDSSRGPLEWASFVLGEDVFDAGRLPATSALLERLHTDLRAINRAANAAFPTRERPRLRSPLVEPSLKSEQPGREVLPSYPSARTMATLVWAEVLSRLFPDRRQDLLAAAKNSAWLRVVGGAHYPTDITGGRLLAERVIRALEDSAEYRQAHELAEREVRQARTSLAEPGDTARDELSRLRLASAGAGASR